MHALPRTASPHTRSVHALPRPRLVPGEADQALAFGLTDLMTSLAVIFVLLLVVFANASRPGPPAESSEGEPGITEVRTMLERAAPSLPLEADPRDPNVVRVIVPESLLKFEFGKSTLAPASDRFLAELMPSFATVLCGTVRPRVAGIVIEGHTDDVGADAPNLRLSQERSFHVLVRGLQAIQAATPEVHACFSELASASGRGKQDLLYDAERRPDRDQSRRVVFKILLRPGTLVVAARPPGPAAFSR